MLTLPCALPRRSAARNPRRGAHPADRDRRRDRRDPHPDRRGRPEAAGEPHPDRSRLVPPRQDRAPPPRARARRAARGDGDAAEAAGPAEGPRSSLSCASDYDDDGLGDGARGARAARTTERRADGRPCPAAPTPTRDAIFAAYEADADDGFRQHLGASLIGKSCERALWYDFRWATPARFPGRMLRLFETGQLEEARLVRNLRRIGATVLEVDPETGRQWRVEAHGGHFGGSLDGVALGLLEAPKTWHVLEFKTHSAKSFRELVAKGVRRGQAAALGADAGLHASDRAHPGDVPRGLQGHRRAPCRAGPRRRRRRRAAARQGRPGSSPRPGRRRGSPRTRPGSSAGSATTTSSATAVSGRRSHLPVLPAFDAGRGRLALRALAAAPRPRHPAPGLRAAPVHARPRPRRGGRRRRRPRRLPDGATAAPGSNDAREAMAC